MQTEEECTTPVFQRRLPPIYRGHHAVIPQANSEAAPPPVGDFPPLVIPVNNEEVIESNHNSELELEQQPRPVSAPTETEFSNRKERHSTRIHLPKEDPIFEGERKQ